jgi:hypothetical protein
MRLEAANGESYTPPEWCFKAARKKVGQATTLGEGEALNRTAQG